MDNNQDWATRRRDWDDLREDMVSLVFNDEGMLSSSFSLSDKPVPSDPTGDECTCPSIKNFPRDTRRPREKAKQAPEKESVTFPISRTFFAELDEEI